MNITIRQPPSMTAVSLKEAKTYLRIDTEAEDQLIEQMIRAASEQLESYAGLALITQTRRASFSVHQGRLKSYPLMGAPFQQLKRKPLLILKDKKVSLDYQLNISKPCAEIEIDLRGEQGTLQIDYICGYGDHGEYVPSALRQSVLLLVAHLYENRLTSVPTVSHTTLLPQLVKAMIQPFRILSVG